MIAARHYLWLVIGFGMVFSSPTYGQESPWEGHHFDLDNNVSSFDSLRIEILGDNSFTWGKQDLKSVHHFLNNVSNMYPNQLTYEMVELTEKGGAIQRYLVNDSGNVFALEKHFKGKGIFFYTKNGKEVTESDFFRLLLAYKKD